MWTLEFYPEQETIGTLVALLDGEAVFKWSVNLDDEKSVEDFITRAKDSQPANVAKAEKAIAVDDLLSGIAARMNK